MAQTPRLRRAGKSKPRASDDPWVRYIPLTQGLYAIVDATTVLRDPFSITVFDPDHSMSEDRYLTVGTTERGRVVVVAHTDRGNGTRIISARQLTRVERGDYEKEIQRRAK